MSLFNAEYNFEHNFERLLPRILQMALETQRRATLTTRQKQALAELLDVVQQLVESVLAHTNHTSNGIEMYQRVEDLLGSISALNNSLSPVRLLAQYGFLRDRIAASLSPTMSPTASSKSIFQLKEEIKRDERMQQFRDGIDEDENSDFGEIGEIGDTSSAHHSIYKADEIDTKKNDNYYENNDNHYKNNDHNYKNNENDAMNMNINKHIYSIYDNVVDSDDVDSERVHISHVARTTNNVNINRSSFLARSQNDMAYTPTRPAFNITSPSLDFLDTMSKKNGNERSKMLRPSMNLQF